MFSLISTVIDTTKPPPPHFVWPHPQSIELLPQFFTINPNQFQIIVDSACDTLTSAIARYNPSRLFIQDCSQMDSSFNGTNFHTETLNLRSDSNHLGELRNLTLLFTGECERYPYFGMVERYYLKVDCEQGAFVFGESIWGALRGLETFSQLLVHVGVDQFVLHTARIHDYPRYSHRGLLIDTSRHFLPKKQILKTIDAMEMNKLNVLHWHMTDDQSFPFESETFPQLSRKGSYHASTHVYKAKDIGDIIEYARLRAVRIIPEFDSPGHTFSWGLGYPQLITACYDEQNQIKGGLLDPTSAVTYSFIRKLFLEIAEKFPDKYFHLGGDEVEDDCWAANINITSFMNRTNMTDDYERLQGFYVGQLVKIANHLNRSSIVWQEVLNSIGDDLPKDVLVQIWIEWPSVDLRWRDAIGNATAAGYKVLLSAPWYLDHISATVDWRRFYEEDPEDFDGTEQQRKLVIGGEACMWGEFTDASNLISKTWPRASAVAERLWSSKALNDSEKAIPRFREHGCRMRRNGLRVGPADGPGYCACDVAM